MKAMFLARNKEMAWAMTQIMGQLIQKGHEFLAVLCSPKIPNPENLMDFMPDFLALELPSDSSDNEADLLIHAVGEKIIISCWTTLTDSVEINKILSGMLLFGLNVNFFETKEEFLSNIISALEMIEISRI